MQYKIIKTSWIYILIIKILKGFNGSYRILLDKKDFYIRRGNKTESMDFSEIKQYVSKMKDYQVKILNFC